MSDLTACSVGAHEHLPVNDDAAAYAGSKGDHDHVFLAFAAAFPHLAERGNVRIISDITGHSCQFFEFLLYFLVFPAKICASVDDSF